jgi:hypothetical protein
MGAKKQGAGGILLDFPNFSSTSELANAFGFKKRLMKFSFTSDNRSTPWSCS